LESRRARGHYRTRRRLCNARQLGRDRGRAEGHDANLGGPPRDWGSVPLSARLRDAKADTNDQVLVDAGVVLPVGRHAVIGEITESWDFLSIPGCPSSAVRSVGAQRRTCAATSGTTRTRCSICTITSRASSARRKLRCCAQLIFAGCLAAPQQDLHASKRRRARENLQRRPFLVTKVQGVGDPFDRSGRTVMLWRAALEERIPRQAQTRELGNVLTTQTRAPAFSDRETGMLRIDCGTPRSKRGAKRSTTRFLRVRDRRGEQQQERRTNERLPYDHCIPTLEKRSRDVCGAVPGRNSTNRLPSFARKTPMRIFPESSVRYVFAKRGQSRARPVCVAVCTSDARTTASPCSVAR
jgi:hypothetical protein